LLRLTDVLRYEDIAKPTAADNEVLVKVHAASVNPLDWHEVEGTRTWCAWTTDFEARKPPSRRRL